MTEKGAEMTRRGAGMTGKQQLKVATLSSWTPIQYPVKEPLIDNIKHLLTSNSNKKE